jgi:hypothetical protein
MIAPVRRPVELDPSPEVKAAVAAGRRHARALDRVEALRLERDAAIRAAVAAGANPAALGRALGLTRARVHQILAGA